MNIINPYNVKRYKILKLIIVEQILNCTFESKNDALREKEIYYSVELL